MWSNKEDTLVLLLEGLGDHNFSLCKGDKNKSEVRENCLGTLRNSYLMKSNALIFQSDMAKLKFWLLYLII